MATAHSRPETAARVVHELIRWFGGRWRGEGSDAAGNRYELAWRVELDLGGAWLSGLADVRPLGARQRDFWGYDAEQHRIVRIFMASNGVYGTVHSAGREGDGMVFEGTAVLSGGASAPVRETIVFRGPDAFEAVWETRSADGDWTLTSREAMKRGS